MNKKSSYFLSEGEIDLFSQLNKDKSLSRIEKTNKYLKVFSNRSRGSIYNRWSPNKSVKFTKTIKAIKYSVIEVNPIEFINKREDIATGRTVIHFPTNAVRIQPIEKKNKVVGYIIGG